MYLMPGRRPSMDKIFMSMTEFMKTVAPSINGVAVYQIEAAAKQEMQEEKDFYYQVRTSFYTIPLMSLQEYFGVVVPVVAPPNPGPMTPETKKVTKPAEKF
jgi:hypothetical protein